MPEQTDNGPLTERRLNGLREAAFSALRLNRSPVTGFTVLASVESIDGSFYGGTNIEVASLSLTKHAEEVAVINGLLDGQDPYAQWIKAVYVVGATPCGSCRQFLWEWADENTVCVFDVIRQQAIVDEARPTDMTPESLEVTTMKDLFPLPFPRREESDLILGDQASGRSP